MTIPKCIPNDDPLDDCPYVTAVWGSGPNDVWFVGENGWYEYDEFDDEMNLARGFLWHYDGTKWTRHNVYTWFWGVWGSAANDVWAVSTYGIYHFDGKVWTSKYYGWLRHFIGVWGLSSTNVYAYNHGGVLHYDGVEWRPMPGLNPALSYSSVWGTAPDNLFVAAYQWNAKLGIMHWDGSTWTEMNRGSSITEVWGFGPNDVLANIDGGISRGTR